MILLVVGDSISYGSELVPDKYKDFSKQSWYDWDFDKSITNDVRMYRETHRWSTILGNKLNVDSVVNLSKPGIGNLQITSIAMSWISSNVELLHDTIAIIGWSNYNRYDYYNDNSNQWNTLYPRYNKIDKDVSKFYFNNLHGDLSSATSHWVSVIALQSIFRLHNIKYCMFNSINAPALPNMSNLINVDSIIPISMTDYCHIKGYKRAPGGHFLEDGNIEWSQVLYNKIMSIVD